METARRDEELVEHLTVLRAQLGDRQALHDIFARYDRRLLYYLRRLLGSLPDAEDALQDVWLAVLRRIATLEQPEAFRAWLYRIAHNRAISRLRGERGRVPLEELPVEAEIDRSTPASDDAAAFALYDAKRVHAALELLSPAHREVLTLRFIDELSYDDIAAIVGCTLGTVRSRIHYAKRSLHDHLSRGSGETKEGKAR